MRFRALAGLVALSSAATFTSAGYHCRTDTSFGKGVNTASKGLALDDNSLRWCASQVPEQWPNSEDPMTSIRLFKAWDSTWDEADRTASWDSLEAYVLKMNASVLLGQQITCNQTEDDRAWEWTKQLLFQLQPEHVMGLAIGNELELLQWKPAAMVPAGCLTRVWDQGYFWRQFQRMVSEIDALGFRSIPVTSVFSGQGLSGTPYYELPGKARVNSFMRNATTLYGDRFAQTWNIYPYFDPNWYPDSGTQNQCRNAISAASCWGPTCTVPATLKQVRTKMAQLTGSSSGRLWIGETGWSWPIAASLNTRMAKCNDWSSVDTFKTVYQGFLTWDLSVGSGVQPPDHVFWFTARDSVNFGAGEHFGLIAGCDEPTCKLKSTNWTAANYTPFQVAVKSYCADVPIYDGWSLSEENCKNKCTMDEMCRFYAIWPQGYGGQYWCRLTITCTSQKSADYAISTYRMNAPPWAPPTTTTTTTTTRVAANGNQANGTSTTAGSVADPTTWHDGVSAWCFQTLTKSPGEVAANEGNQVGVMSYTSITECGAACASLPGCNSFSACPAFARICYFKDRAIQPGDAHTSVPGKCQTYLKVPCVPGSDIQVVAFPRNTTSTTTGKPEVNIESLNASSRLHIPNFLVVLIVALAVTRRPASLNFDFH